ncbi:hypothetical protein SFUMM280S_11042 [Streptomyces fumanus]
MNRRETWLAVASRPLAMDGRIGSTSPMPMKATTDAPAVAHTALGCRRMLPAPASKGSMLAPIRTIPTGRWLLYTHDKLDRLINATHT